MAKSAEVFAVNDRINHSPYGTGSIIEVNAQHTTIKFDNVGVKKFITSMVRLERSATLAPSKPSRASRANASKSTPKP